MTQQNDLGAIQVSGQEMALADRIEATPSYPVEHFGGSWRRVDKPGTKDADNHRVILVSEESRDLIVAGLRRPATTEQVMAAVGEQDRLYASELIADLANGGLPRLEIAARWFRKARLENTAALSPAGDAGREAVEWRRAFYKLLRTASLLQQNSIGCAVNHHGLDVELNGLPGWLADTKKEIDAAEAFMNASPQPAARIGRETIARIIAQHLFNDCGFEACTEAEREPFLRAADSIMALNGRSESGE